MNEKGDDDGQAVAAKMPAGPPCARTRVWISHDGQGEAPQLSRGILEALEGARADLADLHPWRHDFEVHSATTDLDGVADDPAGGVVRVSVGADVFRATQPEEQQQGYLAMLAMIGSVCTLAVRATKPYAPIRLAQDDQVKAIMAELKGETAGVFGYLGGPGETVH
ncbi:MAG: hypothetical protein F4Y57_09000 [Acidobacteria bacterium]|nr:hypothetical protein [Acidobacteriota bacterium]